MSSQNNIDDQVVLNQYPDVAVIFFKLGDDGLPIRDVQDAVYIPDVVDVTSVSLAMGSTGKIGRFTITLNNENNKYFRKDNIEREVDTLKGGTISVSDGTRDANGQLKVFPYNTLPPEEMWLNAKDFLTRRVYNRVVNDSSMIYIYYRDTKDTYTAELDSLPSTIPDSIKEELKKGSIKYRVISIDSTEDFAADISSKTPLQQGISDVSTPAVNLDQIHNAPTRTDGYETLYKDSLVNDVARGNQGTQLTDSTSRILSTLSTSTSNSPTKAETGTKRLSVSEAASILMNSRTNASFFEEFGGQLEHGRCLFEPMQLCTVFMSRRFRNNEPSKDMIQAFTGYVDSVSDGFDGTRQILTIVGSDVTKIMNITQGNVNPSLFTPKLPNAQEYKIWQNRFGATEAWQIIKILTVGGDIPSDSGSGTIDGTGVFTISANVSPDVADVAPVTDQYVSTIELLNGFTKKPTELTGETADKWNRLFFSPRKVHIQTTPFNTSPVSDLQDYSIFKRLFGFSFNNWQNDYQSHLEIANQVASLSNFEFYADATGDIWYHQPRLHNYHILTQNDPEVYILRDEDVLNWNLTESDGNVITSVYVNGSPNFYSGPLEVAQMVGFYEDPSLVSKYGRRMVSVTHPYVATAEDIGYFARSYLIRANVGRYVGKVTILSRPEIRMHMPIYIPSRNMIYYIENIEHTFTFGNQATTTLTLKYGRKPWEVLPEIFDYSKNKVADPWGSAQTPRWVNVAPDEVTNESASLTPSTVNNQPPPVENNFRPAVDFSVEATVQ